MDDGLPPILNENCDQVRFALTVPCIRDRVVQGALKLILEAVFEADFCSNSYGFRPKRSPHGALAEVRRSVMRRMTTVIDVDLSRYFDTIRHSVLLDKIANPRPSILVGIEANV